MLKQSFQNLNKLQVLSLSHFEPDISFPYQVSSNHFCINCSNGIVRCFGFWVIATISDSHNNNRNMPTANKINLLSQWVSFQFVGMLSQCCPNVANFPIRFVCLSDVVFGH